MYKTVGPPIKNIYININIEKTWVIMQHGHNKTAAKRHWTSDPLRTSEFNKCESLHSIPDENQESPKTISNSEEDDKYPSQNITVHP